VKGLRTTIYRVADLVKAKTWYTKAFGIEPYFDEPFYVGFNVGGYELGLQPEEDGVTGTKSPSVISYWGVEDITKEYINLIALGGTKHEEPMNVGGELMVASVFDPWNNLIGIIYNPHFKISE